MGRNKSVDISTRLEIIYKLEQGEWQMNISKQYQLHSSTVSRIWQNREKIKLNSGSPTSKSLKKGLLQDVDEALYKWFGVMSSRNVDMNGIMLQVKAGMIATSLRGNDNGINKGWVDRFKKSHNIVFKMKHGEEKSADSVGAKNWLENRWPQIRQDYEERDIYNTDEFGLELNGRPNGTLVLKDQKCKGEKKEKLRVSVLACCNMDGSDKKKLLLIGRAARPQDFPKSLPRNLHGLPVTYKHNSTAWMTTEIFTEWLQEWDSTLNRKIILLCDNCSSHTNLPELKNIKVEFLPPCTTSILQPLDQGIIAATKVHYKRLLMERSIRLAEEAVEKEKLQEKENQKINVPKVKIYEAIHMISSAWNSVKRETIVNCFRHAGWSSTSADKVQK